MIDFKCPYCKSTLSKRPERKTKCKNCGNFIFVKTDPDTRERLIVTEQEARKIEDRWQKIQYIPRLLGNLKDYGITEQDFLERKKIFYEKNKFEAHDNDIAWSIYNELITKNIDDFSKLKMLYYDMALLLFYENKDFIDTLRESKKMELMEFEDKNIINKIIISSAGEKNACEECLKLDGRILTIDEALNEMPLPNIKCKNNMFSDRSEGFCRCMYLPYFPNINYKN